MNCVSASLRSRFRCVGERDEDAQPLVAQVKSRPNHTAENDREQRVKQWVVDTQMSCHRAAEIACQQDRSEDRGPRNYVYDQADEFDDRENGTQAEWIAKPVECFDNGSRHNQMPGGIEEKKQCRQCDEDASGPKSFFHALPHLGGG